MKDLKTRVWGAGKLLVLVGALLAARRTSSTIRQVNLGALLFAISMTLMVVAPNLLTAYPVAIFMGFASIMFMTSATAIVQMRSRPEMRGRVLALQAIVFLGSTPIGGPVLGAVSQAWGARMGFLVGAVACYLAYARGWWAVRRTPALADDAASVSSTAA